MHELKYIKDDLITIESFLEINPYGSMQRSVRTIEKVHLFHPIHLNKQGHERKIEGFIWSPIKDDLFYEIDLSAEIPTISINLGSGRMEEDISRIIAEIPHLGDTAGVRREAMGKRGGNGKGKKGYYLEAGTAKKGAIANFQAAVKDGIGSNDFVEFCIPRHFKMKYFKGSQP